MMREGRDVDNTRYPSIRRRTAIAKTIRLKTFFIMLGSIRLIVSRRAFLQTLLGHAVSP
jgi:hypothetical protein